MSPPALRIVAGAAFTIGLLLGPALPSQSQTTTSTASKTRTHVQTLASDKLEGRMAGSEGEKLAADYIAGELTRIDAKPLPGMTSVFQPFEFTAGTKDAGSSLSVAIPGAAPQTFATTENVQALSFSDNGEVTGPVVFAGYGLVVPESQNFGYDSYAGLDVKDKVVLVLRYFPEDADQKTRGILSRYSDLRYKAMAARQRGAKALVVVTGPRSPNAGATIPMTFDTALAGSGIVAASIGRAAAQALFAPSKKDLEAVQKELDSGNPHVAGFVVPDVTVTVKAAVERQKQTAKKRGGGVPRLSVGPTGGDDSMPRYDPSDDDLGPDFIVTMEEEMRRLMAILPDETLRRIAGRKLEGYSSAEIATELGVVERTVERKLALIRATWAPAAEV